MMDAGGSGTRPSTYGRSPYRELNPFHGLANIVRFWSRAWAPVLDRLAPRSPHADPRLIARLEAELGYAPNHPAYYAYGERPFERDFYRCQICGAGSASDHIPACQHFGIHPERILSSIRPTAPLAPGCPWGADLEKCCHEYNCDGPG